MQYCKTMPMGRPPALLPEQHATFAGLCRAGLTDEELAVRYRMTAKTASNWRKKLAPETIKVKGLQNAPETSTMPNDQDKKERGPLAGTPETSNAMPDVQRQDDTHREAS